MYHLGCLFLGTQDKPSVLTQRVAPDPGRPACHGGGHTSCGLWGQVTSPPTHSATHLHLGRRGLGGSFLKPLKARGEAWQGGGRGNS